MQKHGRQSGLTLTELVVTVAILAILLAIGVPAAKRLAVSLQDTAGTQGLINAALSNARAIAVRHHKYAGVRFQQAADGKAYMVFIVHDYDGTGYANGFRAVEGRKAIALPEGTYVMAPGIPSFSIVFSPSGKLVIHGVRFKGKLEVMNSMDWDDGGDFISVNSFYIQNQNEPGVFKTMRVSPYTGELIGE
jgi:prepilin-type N-terminal cleavage/methylation domain-containing protein